MTTPARPSDAHRRGGLPVTFAGLIALALAVTAVPAAAQAPETEADRAPATDPAAALPRATSVQGTSRLLGEVDPGRTTLEDGVLRLRENVLATEEQSSDPRVSGRALIWVNFDVFADAGGSPQGFQVRYGRMRLVNDDGAWEGPFSGRLNEAGYSQTYWLRGEGAYDGLTYVVTAGGSGPLWTSSGLIYPGSPPADIPPELIEQELPVLPPLALN